MEHAKNLREITTPIRLSKDESEDLEAAAIRAGLPKSTYIRLVALKAARQPRAEAAE